MIIGSLCGHNEVAYYGVAYSLAMASSLFISSVNSSLIPWTYKQMATGEEKQIRRIGHVGFSLSSVLAGILLLVIGLGPEIMLFLAPAKYQSAVWVIPPVALSVLASMYVWLFVNVETYYGENGYVALVSIAAAVLNIVLNYIFIPLFGYLAAGWTTLAGYILMAYGHAFFTRRIQRQRSAVSAYNVKKLTLLLIGTTVLSSLFMVLYRTTIVRYVVIGVLCIVAIWQRKAIIGTLAILRGRNSDEPAQRD